MFNNCTSIVNPPELPETDYLADESCASMFSGCTSLKSTPNFFANIITFNESCCSRMFEGCTGLTMVPDFNPSYVHFDEKCCEYMFYGCTGIQLSEEKTDVYTQPWSLSLGSTYATQNMFAETGGPFCGEPEPGRIYYQPSTNESKIHAIESADSDKVFGKKIYRDGRLLIQTPEGWVDQLGRKVKF